MMLCWRHHSSAQQLPCMSNAPCRGAEVVRLRCRCTNGAEGDDDDRYHEHVEHGGGYEWDDWNAAGRPNDPNTVTRGWCYCRVVRLPPPPPHPMLMRSDAAPGLLCVQHSCSLVGAHEHPTHWSVPTGAHGQQGMTTCVGCKAALLCPGVMPGALVDAVMAVNVDAAGGTAYVVHVTDTRHDRGHQTPYLTATAEELLQLSEGATPYEDQDRTNPNKRQYFVFCVDRDVAVQWQWPVQPPPRAPPPVVLCVGVVVHDPLLGPHSCLAPAAPAASSSSSSSSRSTPGMSSALSSLLVI